MATWLTHRRIWQMQHSVLQMTFEGTMSKREQLSRDRAQLRSCRQGKRSIEAENNRPAGRISLQIIGNGSAGSPKAVYVFTDKKRYLFNCGEGTQRLANEYKARLSKLEHVFITYGRWENVGGLTGLVLTMQDIGVPEINLHGPDGIEQLFKMTKGFMLTNDITINKISLDEGAHSDSIMKVKYVPFYGPHIKSLDLDDSRPSIEQNLDYFDHQRRRRQQIILTDCSSQQQQAKRPKVDSGSSSSNREELKRDVSVAYICQPSNKPGQLILEKCVDFGVPAGPLLGQLKNGLDVTLKDGRVVKSSDVVEPDQIGPVFVVVECPAVEFLDSLLECEDFRPHMSGATDESSVAVAVVHLTPSHVVRHEKYQQWMKRFSSKSQHLMVNDDNGGPASLAVHRIQYKLNMLQPRIFPLLKEKLTEEMNDLKNSAQLIRCGTQFHYHLRPLTKADHSASVVVNPEEFYKECQALEDFPAALEDLKLKLQMPENVPSNSDTTGCYPEVLFLGTGSAVPGKVRNASGILIHLSAEDSILLDCGEGTSAQLHRFYGVDDVDLILRKIKAVFISHLHADHHIGLIELLKRRRSSFEKIGAESEPIDLLAPHPIIHWLSAYHCTFEPILDCFRLLSNADFFPEKDRSFSVDYRKLLAKLSLQKIETASMKHCKFAFGIAITHNDKWKLVFSGDTMPCNSLVDIGKDCDLLIHEATMEDDLEQEALYKRHSTTSQAIQQGIKMNAKFTILTHFSQRYAKVPIFTDKFGNHSVGVAFDNLRISLQDLKHLPLLMPALKLLFSEDYEDMQEKAAKKLRQRQLMEDQLLAMNK